jgi:hypothetical protein
MDENSMIGNKSLSSLLKNKKGMISTLIGGGRDESNLVIPYSLYTSSSSFKIDPDLDNVSVSDTDSDDNEEGEEEGEKEVEAEMDVIDDDIYEKLLHLMDAENEEMDLGTSPSSSSNISLLIEEQIDKPSITERIPNNSNSNSIPLFSTNKVNASRKNRKDGRKIKKNTTNKNKDKKGELKEKIHSPKSKSKKIMTAISHKNQGKVRNKTKKQRKGLMDTLTSIF